MKEVEIPHIYYLYLHSKIWEMAQGKLVQEKELKKYLFQWKIPKEIRSLIVKELIMLGLLEKEKKYLLKIKKPEFDIKDINKYYQQLKIF